jgi:hypothetical protein
MFSKCIIFVVVIIWIDCFSNVVRAGAYQSDSNSTSYPYSRTNLFSSHIADSDLEYVKISDHLLNNLMIIPEYRFMFCGIEKVAITSFTLLFTSFIYTVRNKEMPPRHFFYLNSYKQLGLTMNDVKRILLDKTWYKAVFFREPLSRFLSGYNSKCTPGHDADRSHCVREFGSENASFDIAMWKIGNHFGNGQHIDEHWELQSRFCGGLNETIQYYNFIQEFDQDVRNKVIHMLEEAKFPIHENTAYGLKLRTVVNRNFPDSHSSYFNDTLKSSHRTHSDEHLQEKYRTIKNALKVARAYAKDYELFKPSFPSWLLQMNLTR